MSQVRFFKALTGSLLLHALLLTLFLMVWKGVAPLQPERPVVPVELVWFKDNKKVTPPPENPDLLAQVNHVTENKSVPTPSSPKPDSLGLSEKPAMAPEAVTTSIAADFVPPQGVSPQTEEERNKTAIVKPVAPSGPAVQQKIEKKTINNKPLEKEKKTKDKAPVEIAKTIKKEPKSLDLSPSFAEISRWDQEKKERNEGANGREQTLDLNTSQVRYAVYFARLKERIEQAWIYPQQAKNFNLSGNLLVKFTIGRDGTLLAVNLVRSSGETILDSAALNALKTAAPFAPLPDNWQLDRVNVMTTFEYIHNKKLWKR